MSYHVWWRWVRGAPHPSWATGVIVVAGGHHIHTTTHVVGVHHMLCLKGAIMHQHQHVDNEIEFRIHDNLPFINEGQSTAIPSHRLSKCIRDACIYERTSFTL